MSPESIIYKFRSSRTGRLALHVSLWLFYFLAMYYLVSISFNRYRGLAALYEPLKNTLTAILVYYPLVYCIWPMFLSRRKYFKGLMLMLLLVVVYAIADHILERLVIFSCEICMERLKSDQYGYYQLFQRGAINVIIVHLISLGILYQLFVFLAFPLTVKILLTNFQQRIQTLRLQQENIQLEFNFLKSQVNPHFLFNTLNNIYALILKDEKNASAETVSKLAAFMRYSLYESGSNGNNILKEIDLLNTYIDLEKIRLNDTVVNFLHKTDDDAYTVPPLLFIPAVENAFKYCANNSEGNAYIFMKLEILNAKL